MAKSSPRSTVLFRIYYYKNSSQSGKQEGTLWMTDENHRIVKDSELHFNNFDEIPTLMRRLLGSPRQTSP
jgi:hypothetical protein